MEKENVIGKKFGMLTVLSDISRTTPCGSRLVNVVCDCGAMKDVALGNLKSGTTKSCGCSNYKKEDFLGKRFGRLEVVGELKPKAVRKRMMKVVCDCGQAREVGLNELKRGNTTSCGCYKNSMVSRRMRTHGYSKHPAYHMWFDMVHRCSSKKNKHFDNYGGRGITVCEDWRIDPKHFCDFAVNNGWRVGLEVDRIDNDKGYSPDNVRFVTRIVNVSNTRLLKRNNKTGYRGVSYTGKSFKVSVNFKGFETLHKEGFKTAAEAAMARDEHLVKNNIIAPMNFGETI